MKSAHIVIQGRPRSKKNGKQISTRGGRVHVRSSTEYLAWESSAIRQVRDQWVGRPALTGQVLVVGKVYQDRGQAIDLTNAFEGAWDVLESAGVLANDYQITGCTLERRRDRDNPRIEISIHLRNCEDDL